MPNILMRKAGLAFDPTKTKLALKKATLRLVIVIESKTSSVKAKRSKAAVELESGLQLQAYMDVEQVIRQDFTIQAYETLLRLCNLLADRMDIVAAEKECPPEVEQAVCTIIWAANEAEVPELLVVKAQLTRKYGKEFALKAQTNANRSVNVMVAEKLFYQNDPSATLVNDYLVAIAMELNVKKTIAPSPRSGGRSTTSTTSAADACKTTPKTASTAKTASSSSTVSTTPSAADAFKTTPKAASTAESASSSSTVSTRSSAADAFKTTPKAASTAEGASSSSTVSTTSSAADAFKTTPKAASTAETASSSSTVSTTSAADAFKTPSKAAPTTSTETASSSSTVSTISSTPPTDTPLTPDNASSVSEGTASSPVIIEVSKDAPAAATLDPKVRVSPHTVHLSSSALRTVRRAAPTSHPVGYGLHPAARDTVMPRKLYI